MPPAAEFVVHRPAAHDSSTSLDVFGNDLGDVDIWGDEKPEENVESSRRAMGHAAHEALPIVQRESSGTENHGGVPKPPRTPSTRERELRAELLQMHGTVLSQSGRRSRRPSLSDSGRSAKSASDSSPNLNSSMSQLPPMTPRTRSRKLGLPLAPLVPPIDVSPQVKTLSVAEKRRLRNEEKLNASSKALDFSLEDKAETKEFTVDWAHSRANKAASQSQSQRSLFQELQVKAPKFGHTRNHSDSNLAFSLTDLFQSSENGAFINPCLVPDVGNTAPERSTIGSEIAGKNSESKALQRPRVRESRKDVKEIVVQARSMSLPRKNNTSLRRNSRTNAGSDHQENNAKPTSPNQQKRRSNSGNRAPSDELQKHLRSIFGENKDSESGVNIKNSTHSGSTKSSRSSSRSRKKKESSDDTGNSGSSPTPRDTEIAKPSSFSRRRREPHETTKLPRKSLSSPAADNRSNGVPRAGHNIRFVRKSINENAVSKKTDDSDAKSSGEKSSKSAKSRVSSTSSKSPRSGRRASLGENYSTNVNPREGRASACPPSPGMRRSSRARSPGKGRAAEGGEKTTSRTSLTPRRRIRYVRDSEGSPQIDAPSLPNLG